MWEQWGVEFLAFPLTWHIAYRTSRDERDLTCLAMMLSRGFNAD